MLLTFSQMKLKKKAKCGAESESALELNYHTPREEASGRESCVERDSNVQVAEKTTIEQNGGAEEPPQDETASAPVLKDEQDRPHYNPHQGG